MSKSKKQNKGQKTLSSYFSSIPKINQLDLESGITDQGSFISKALENSPKSKYIPNKNKFQIVNKSPNAFQSDIYKRDFSQKDTSTSEDNLPALRNSQMVIDLDSDSEIFPKQTQFSKYIHQKTDTRGEPNKKRKLEPETLPSVESINDTIFQPTSLSKFEFNSGNRNDSISTASSKNLSSAEKIGSSKNSIDFPNQKSEKFQINDLLNPIKNIKYTPLELQVIQIKKDNPDVLLAVEVGYKYKFFGNDAIIASKVLGIMCFTSQNFKSCSIPVHRIMLHARRLVYAGHKVGIVNQTETSAIKSAGNNKSAPFERKLLHIYTRGTLIGEVFDSFQNQDDGDDPAGLVDSSGGGYILSLVDFPVKSSDKTSIGVVAADPSTGSIIYDSFEDDFSRKELATRFAHLNPVEVVLSLDSSPDTSKFIKYYNSTNTFRIEKYDQLSISNAMGQMVDEFTKINASSALNQILSGVENSVIVALELLFRYLKQFKLETIFCSNEYLSAQNQAIFLPGSTSQFDKNNFNSKPSISSDTEKEQSNAGTNCLISPSFDRLSPVLVPFTSYNYMALDSNSFSNLQIFSSNNSIFASELSNPSSKKNTSFLQEQQTTKTNIPSCLFELLNHTITPIGYRVLFNWLQKPLIQSNLISERLQVVELISESEKFLLLEKGSKLSSTNSLSIEYLNSLDSGKEIQTASLSWLLKQVKSILYSIVNLESGLCRIRCEKANPAEVVRILTSFYRAVSLFSEEKFQNSNLTKDQIFLSKVKEFSESKNSELKSLLKIVEYSKLEPFIKILLGCINKESAKTSNWEKLFSFDDSTEESEATQQKKEFESFSDKDTSNLNTTLENEEINNIWNKSLEPYVENYKKAILNLEDIWKTEAEVFKDPKIKPKSVLVSFRNSKFTTETICVYFEELKGLTKCIGIWDAYISLGYVARLDGYCKPKILNFSQDKGSKDHVTDGVRSMILTGPNMGGKSTFIRTVGILAVMAQIGSFVPATEMELTPLDGIYIRMGAYDQIMQNQSTFMVEMMETSKVIQKSTMRSLVILDELGRGTGTIDGSAIASATLEYLLDGGSCGNEENEEKCFSSNGLIGPTQKRDDCNYNHTGSSLAESYKGPLVLFVTHYAHLVEQFSCSRYMNIAKPYFVSYIKCGKSGNKTNENEDSSAEGYNDDIIFLYKLVEGINTESYGIQVAKMSGIRKSILDNAFKISKNMKTQIDKKISSKK
ncbi:hypothetical protein BB560_004055 [Smittium megazygosporum]|uniref:DNA mismatch repair protein n=1 Tax=Smittium megazygosporum TaxID=133381 RepID=A0A2T9ZAC2_9FUNG|nr:hypothetical protein BB560_004055 [Smittium megazygosporum]